MKEPRFEALSMNGHDARRIIKISAKEVRDVKRLRSKAERRRARECLSNGRDDLASDRLRANGWVA